MRVEKWREDAQPGELGDATATEELPDDDEGGDSSETGSIEDRWARLGVFPAVTNQPPRGPAARDADHTVSLRGDSPYGERQKSPRGVRADGPRDAHRSAGPGEEPVGGPRPAGHVMTPRGERKPGALTAEPGGDRADAGPPAGPRQEHPDARHAGHLSGHRSTDRTTAPRGEQPDSMGSGGGTVSENEGRLPGPDRGVPPRGDRPDTGRIAAAFRKAPVDASHGVDGITSPRGGRAARPGRDGALSSRGGEAAAGRSATASADAGRTAGTRVADEDPAPRGDAAKGAAGPRGPEHGFGRAPAADAEPEAGTGDGSRDMERTTVLRSPAAAAKGPWPAPAAATGVAATASVRDPWQEEPAGEAGAVTHDPHEVTVQLDAVQFGDGVLHRAPVQPKTGSPDAADGPVFVDESGRRSRRYRRIGMAVGLACAGYAAVIVATLLSGNSDAPWLPVPGQQQKEQPAGKVETSPDAGETDATPGAGTSLLPGGSPSAGASTLPVPGASVPAPGTTAGRDEPGSSRAPEPTATRQSENPGTGGGDTPASEAPVQPPSSPVAPTTPAEDPDPAPETTAPTTGGGGGGDDTAAVDTAAGPDAGQPVAAGNPGAEPGPSASPAAPSPEYVL